MYTAIRHRYRGFHKIKVSHPPLVINRQWKGNIIRSGVLSASSLHPQTQQNQSRHPSEGPNPEAEEFLVMLYGFVLWVLLLVDLAEFTEALGVDTSATSFHLLEQLSSYIILAKYILLRCIGFDLSDLSFFHILFNFIYSCDRDSGEFWSKCSIPRAGCFPELSSALRFHLPAVEVDIGGS